MLDSIESDQNLYNSHLNIEEMTSKQHEFEPKYLKNAQLNFNKEIFLESTNDDFLIEKELTAILITKLTQECLSNKLKIAQKAKSTSEISFSDSFITCFSQNPSEENQENPSQDIENLQNLKF